MDNIPEREQPKAERIKLGQKFNILQNPNPEILYRGRQYNTIELDTEIVPTIKLNPSIQWYVDTLKLAFAPFDLEAGYRVTNEDFNVQARKEKVELLKKQNPNPIENLRHDPSSEYGIYLPSRYAQIFVTANQLDNVDDHKKEPWKEQLVGGKPLPFKQNSLDILKSLYLRLHFPNLSFDGRVDRENLNYGTILFSLFYPSDSLPLANIGQYIVAEGQPIAVPFDIKKLSQIQASFALEQEYLSEGDESTMKV